MDARVERRDISYDELMKLPYLDAICKETLRLCVVYPQIAIYLPHPYYLPGLRRSLSCIECKLPLFILHVDDTDPLIEKPSQRFHHSFIASGVRERRRDNRLCSRPSRDDGNCRRGSCEQRPNHMGTRCGPVDSGALASASARNRHRCLFARGIPIHVGVFGICLLLWKTVLTVVERMTFMGGGRSCM
jgi:hypothetical protein